MTTYEIHIPEASTNNYRGQPLGSIAGIDSKEIGRRMAAMGIVRAHLVSREGRDAWDCRLLNNGLFLASRLAA